MPMESMRFWGGIIFSGAVVSHIAFRMIVKVRAARHKRRGAVHQPRLFGQMIAACFILIACAWGEWALRIWPFAPWIMGAGGSLYLLSAFLQWRAFRDLGEAYSPDIEVRQ